MSRVERDEVGGDVRSQAEWQMTREEFEAIAKSEGLTLAGAAILWGCRPPDIATYTPDRARDRVREFVMSVLSTVPHNEAFIDVERAMEHARADSEKLLDQIIRECTAAIDGE